MANRKAYDPLQSIPSAGLLREKVAETEEKLRKLKIVLRVAEEIENPTPLELPKKKGVQVTEVSDEPPLDI